MSGLAVEENTVGEIAAVGVISVEEIAVGEFTVGIFAVGEKTVGVIS